MPRETRLRLLLGLFIAMLMAMNVLGSKLTTVFGVTVSVAIFMVPVTFFITDVVAEVYGRRVANEFVWIGGGTLVLMMALTWVSLRVTPADRFIYDREFGLVFGSSLRILLASVVAFFLSQLHDVWAFEWWRKKTAGRHLWLRNNASTLVSQALDTFIFMMIAFYGAAPGYTLGFILELAAPYYVFKAVFALLDTPFVYAGVRWLRNGAPQTAAEGAS